jgi:hypothetical protein
MSQVPAFLPKIQHRICVSRVICPTYRNFLQVPTVTWHEALCRCIDARSTLLWEAIFLKLAIRFSFATHRILSLQSSGGLPILESIHHCAKKDVSPAQSTASFVFILTGYQWAVLSHSYLTKHDFVVAFGGVKGNSMCSLTLALHVVRALPEPRAERSFPGCYWIRNAMEMLVEYGNEVPAAHPYYALAETPRSACRPNFVRFNAD